MFHHLEKALLHDVCAGFSHDLVLAAENYLEVVWTNARVEVVCVLCWGTDPFAEFFVVGHAGACGDDPELNVFIELGYASHSTDDNLQSCSLFLSDHMNAINNQ